MVTNMAKLKLGLVLIALVVVSVGIVISYSDNPPRVNLNSPKDGELVSGKVSVAGFVEGDADNYNVKLFLSSNKKFDSAYTDSGFNFVLDTSSLESGAYTLDVSARSLDGSYSGSEKKEIIVKDPGFLEECKDGVDNDKDGFIDLADDGCIDSGDNSEYTSGQEIFLRNARETKFNGLLSDARNSALYEREVTLFNKLMEINKEFRNYLVKNDYAKEEDLPNDVMLIEKIEAYKVNGPKSNSGGFLIFTFSDKFLELFGVNPSLKYMVLRVSEIDIVAFDGDGGFGGGGVKVPSVGDKK